MNKAVEDYVGQIKELKEESNKTLLERLSDNLDKNGFDVLVNGNKLKLSSHFSQLLIKFDNEGNNIKDITITEINNNTINGR